jgi:CheY-like chemotaxis protein
MTADPRMSVQGDPVRLQQVVWNLLSNAVKFTPTGGRVETALSMDDTYVQLRVADTGRGIGSEFLPLIFDRFRRAEGGSTHVEGGLGLGLAIARQLVEMHGGTIEAISDGPGTGSKFVVRLPALPSLERPLETAGAGRPKAAPRQRRILIVDDSVDSAQMLARLLRLEGHEPYTVHDGLEAVTAAAQLRPDVVLMDLGLPTLNGFEACRRIRREPWGEGIVIFALTGWGQDADRRRTSDSGFDHHLVKPVDPRVLMTLIDREPSRT